MKQRFDVGDYVWFRWYVTGGMLLAGVVTDVFESYREELAGVQFYRITDGEANFNGVLDKMIERKMKAHEIVQHKLMGLIFDDTPIRLSSEACSPSP